MFFVECETVILLESVKLDRIYDAPAVSVPLVVGTIEDGGGGILNILALLSSLWDVFMIAVHGVENRIKGSTDNCALALLLFGEPGHLIAKRICRTHFA